jgi:hypothetical protein
LTSLMITHNMRHALTLGNRRVQQRTHNPVGGSPTEGKRFSPRSLGGAVAGNQDGKALRQYSL